MLDRSGSRPLETSQPSRSAAHIEAALSGNLAPNLTASAVYRGLLSGDGGAHTLQARLALAF